MTNSPNASPSWRIWPLTWDLFTRAINQGLLSEWGSTHSGTYPNSNWRFDDHLWFYSSDEFPLTNQYPGHSNRYAIDAWIGQIAVFGAQQPIQVVCKG